MSLNSLLKSFFFCTLILTIPIYRAAAQQSKGSVRGTVLTADGKPAANITVALNGFNVSTITDAEGQFSLQAAPGDYTLVVYSMFYHQRQQPVTIEEGKTLQLENISVIENQKQLDEVVVTGQYRPQSLQKSVYKIKVIGAKQIESKGVTSLPNLLNTEAGIRLSNDMALGETDIELMGMSGNNVKVLIDGIPVLDRLSTKQSLSQIDVNTIERIEIVEGPMSVIYGTDALAGVINVITKKKAASDVKTWSVQGSLQEESVGKEYSFGSGDGLHSQSLTASYFAKNGLFGTGTVTHNQSGGWQGNLTGRAKQWQPKEQLISGIQTGFKGNSFSAWYRLDYLWENILNKADVNTVAQTTSNKEFLVDRFTHQLQSEWKVSPKVSLNAAASFQQYDRRTRTTNIDLATGKETLSLDEGANDKTNFSQTFARVSGVWSALGNLTIQPGVEFQTVKGTGNRIDGEQQMNNTALFLTAEYSPWEWLNIRPGIRSSFNSSFDAPKAIPSLNAKVSLNKITDLRISYGRGYRAPTLQELYYTFHDSNHNLNGNPDLEAEHSNSYLASLLVRTLHNKQVRLSSSLSLFYNDFKNRISLVESSTVPGRYVYQNIDRYKTTGFTVENTLSTDRVSANVAFTMVGRYNKYSGSNEVAPNTGSMFRFSPEVSGNITYSLPKVADFSLYYKFTGERREYMLTSNNEVDLVGLDSYHWADFTISKNLMKHFTIDLGVRNIFNVSEVKSNSSSGSGHSTSSFMGNGRSYFTSVKFNF